MSPAIILLVFLSSCLHATWNYLAKTIPSGLPFVWLMAATVTVLYTPVALWYVFHYEVLINARILFSLIGTAVLHLVYFLFLQKGYQSSDLSVVYPLARGTGPVFATVGAVFLLQEKVTGSIIIGLMIITAGVLLITGLKPQVLQNERSKAGLFYGIGTGILIAVYTLWDSYAVKTLAIAPLLLEYFSHPFRVIVLLPAIRNSHPEIRRIWRQYATKIIIISIIAPLSFMLVLYALQRAPVHFVAPARELSIVIGVILGGRLLTEAHFQKRLLGSVLIVAGIALLSFYR